MPRLGSLVRLAPYHPADISRDGIRSPQPLLRVFRRSKHQCSGLSALHPGYVLCIQHVHVILHQPPQKKTITCEWKAKLV